MSLCVTHRGIGRAQHHAISCRAADWQQCLARQLAGRGGHLAHALAHQCMVVLRPVITEAELDEEEHF